MNNNPLVSVFIVTYNSSEYIVDALESVKAQTYRNIELIVSDDKSSDDTVAIVKDWFAINQDRFVRVKLVETSVNTGTAGNYNRAVAVCQGEWLKMLDGDDMLLPNCVEDNLIYVSENKEAKVVFSNCSHLIHTKNGKTVIKEKMCSPKLIPFSKMDTIAQLKKLLVGNILLSSTAFISSDVLKRFRYDEQYFTLEDYPMWLKISYNGIKIHYFDKSTAVYRIGDSVSSNSQSLFPQKYLEICRRFFYNEQLPIIRELNVYEAYNYNRRYYFWYDLCELFLRNRKNIVTIPLYWMFKCFVFTILYFRFEQ